MDNPIMFRTRLMSVLLASVIGSSLGLTLPARATDSDAAERTRPFAVNGTRHSRLSAHAGKQVVGG